MNALGRRSFERWRSAPAPPTSSDLPPEAPLAMPAQAFWGETSVRTPNPIVRDGSWRAAALIIATVLLTTPAVAYLFASLRIDGISPLDVAILLVFALLFAWIVMAFLSALAGFIPGGRVEGDSCLDPATPRPGLASRTAILSPIYNEDPHPLFARLRAMAGSLEAVNAAGQFDIFVLSDTTQPQTQAEEYALFRRLRDRMSGRIRLYYRHRALNLDRKAGNLSDWVVRFGGAYDHMVVLDADSLMSGDTLVRLAAAMERDPEVGLIQTTPVLINRNSLLARAQQFACGLYGPLLARGVAWWSGAQGNYWGHNAILRLTAFAGCAGLPHLPGRKPFGGHILSHDFVEAALLRRAGWTVRMAPLLGGSYEESPPTLTDLIARDRRWCQGNFQHLLVLPGRGLHWISRLHLLRGVCTYLTAPFWLSLMIMGVLLALQPACGLGSGVQAAPSADVLRHTAVTITDLFIVSMGLLMAPKVLAFFAMLASPRERRRFGGARRVLGGMLLETVLSSLIAPVMMFNQIRALFSILAGRDSGWPAQARQEGGLSLAEAARRHAPDTIAGLILGVAALIASGPLFLWMSPVILGLVSAIPLTLITARQDLGLKARKAGLLLIPEETAPPRLIIQANNLLERPLEPRPDQSSTWSLAGGRVEPLFG